MYYEQLWVKNNLLYNNFFIIRYINFRIVAIYIVTQLLVDVSVYKYYTDLRLSESTLN